MMNKKGLTMEQRYQRAQTLLQGLATDSLVQNDRLFPHWIENTDCFWYERATRLNINSQVKIGKQYQKIIQ